MKNILFPFWVLLLGHFLFLNVPTQAQEESEDSKAVPEEVAVLRSHASQRLRQGRMAEQTGNEDLAASEYDATVESIQAIIDLGYGEEPEFLFGAQLQAGLGRSEAAIAFLEQGTTAFPESVRMSMAYAQMLTEFGEYEVAYTKFGKIEEKWAQDDPDLFDDQFYFMFGMAAERAGHYDEAQPLFRLAIQLAPKRENPERAARAYNYLGYMWLEQGESLEEAGKLIKRANELQPDSGAYVDSLGWYYFLKEDYREALKQLLRAGELVDLTVPENAVILEHIAQAYFQLGHKDKAIDTIREAIALATDDEKQGFKDRLKLFRNEAAPAKQTLDFLKGGEEKEPGGGEEAVELPKAS